MKRYLCILFLLFDCFIFRGDYVSAFGADRLVEAVYIGAGDFSTAYAYNASRDMTRNLNKGISNITYNLLNLPGEITFTDGRKVKYIYTADGTKVRTTYYDATGSQTLQVDYCGNYILRNGVVDRILTTSGYIKNDTVYSYVKDYQGNIRSVVRQDGAVVESTDYYPYGTPFTTAGAVQPYKYGSKELDRMHGLDLYDSQARWYDSLLGRTSTMDPKAEKYYNLSPYLWCAGNPVRYIDPDGNYVIGNDNKRVTFNKETGKLSDNLSNSQFVIFNAMLKTEIGSQRLNDVLEAEYSIGFRIESTSFGKKCGETKTFTTIDSETGEKTIAFVNIVLFNEEISEMLGRETLYKGNGLTLEDAIGAIATHEARHATDKNANERFEPSEYKREELAGSDEKEYINERINER